MKTIKQTVLFNASPAELYEAILNPKIHSEFTGSKATNSQKVGGKFSAYDGYIWGTNLELEKDKKIVQNWACSDFPDGHFSRATFEFKKVGNKTKLVFTHEGVPEKEFEKISAGWFEFYWAPLKKILRTD